MSTYNNNVIHIINKTLIEEANKILSVPANEIPRAAPLVYISEILDDILQQDIDENIEFVAFFLSVFLNDLLFNLTGDIPYYEKIDKKRGEYFQQVARILVQIPDTLENGEYISCHNLCVTLVKDYVNVIRQLNKMN